MRLLPQAIREIKSDVAKSISFSQRQMGKLGKLQKEYSVKATGILSSNFTRMSKYLGFSKYFAADDFFFQFVKLPPLGKEYWFLHFTDPKTGNQLVATFGRAQSKMDINRLKIKGQDSLDGTECAAVIWLFDGNKKVLQNSREIVNLSAASKENALGFNSKKGNFIFQGKYPHYFLGYKSGKNAISLKIMKSKKGRPYEILNSFSPTIGMGLVNLYFDFEGKMLGREFSGKCYVQKVILTTPFIPWNWGRLYFKDGGVFEFFSVYSPILPASIKLFAHAHYFDFKKNKTHNFSDVSIEKTADGSKWHIFGNKYSLYTSSYASHPFTFKGIGEFKYLEYFAKSSSLAVNGKSCGDGFGILEDAVGFVM